MLFRFSLDGSWRLQHCEPGIGETAGFHRPDYESEGWIDALVPGDVHLDLLNAGIIDDPLVDQNAASCYWIDDEEWWYRRIFDLPEDLPSQRVLLRCEGLDTTATIWLNGVHVGDHGNFFRPFSAAVTPWLRKGTNVLAVRINSGLLAAKGKPLKYWDGYGKPDQEGALPRPWIRKPAYMFRWDWSPRLLTCGIWQSVSLIAHESLAIRDVYLYSRLGRECAVVKVKAEVENLATEPQQAMFTARLAGDGVHTGRLWATLAPGGNMIEMPIAVHNPRLWWPNGLGDPYLYDFALDVADAQRVRDIFQCRYGIREVEVIQKPAGGGEQSFVFAVNGQRVFARGANWAPADSIPARVDRDRYFALIDAARAANFNMFRVNGVGLHERNEFYDCCDELGIMVWQDFAYSCAYYPDDDAAFVKEAEREAEATVRRLRNHPSLVLWCGNNENQWHHFMRKRAGHCEHHYGETIYHRMLPKICDALDPNRPYWPGSPYGGEDPNDPRLGDTHAWTVAILSSAREDFTAYGRDRGKFISEFGYLAPPACTSLERFLPADQCYPGSPAWEFHTNLMEKGIFERGLIARALRRYFGLDPQALSLPDYVLYSQIVQAEALRCAIEHFRRQKYDCAGVLFWSYNDCWGASTSWSIIDYYLTAKPSYYAVRRALQPVLVSLKPEDDGCSIWLTNDTTHELRGELHHGISTLDGAVLQQEIIPLTVPADSSQWLGHSPWPGATDKRADCIHWARFTVDGAIVAENSAFVAPLQEMIIPQVSVQYYLEPVQVNQQLLHLRSTAYAWYVHIEAPAGVQVADNYFDLFPGEEKIVVVHGPLSEASRLSVCSTAKPQGRGQDAAIS